MQSTNARWFRADLHNENMEKHLPLLSFVIQPIIDEEEENTKKQPGNVAAAGVPQLAENSRFVDNDGQCPVVDIELDEEDEKDLPAEYDGSAAQFLKIVQAPTLEDRAAQRDLGKSHKDPLDLFRYLESHDGGSGELFKDKYWLELGKKYLSEDLQPTSKLSPPQFQKLTQKNRERFWKTVIADILKVMHKSATHRKRGFFLITKVFSALGFQLYDPLFGLWETWAEGRMGFPICHNALRRLPLIMSYSLSVCAKRAGASVLKNQKDLVKTWVEETNTSFPATEFDQEAQFKDDHANKAWVHGDSSLWSKDWKRMLKADAHPAYYPAPQVYNADRLSVIDPSEVLKTQDFHKNRRDATTAEIEAMNQVALDARILSAGHINNLYVQRYKELRDQIHVVDEGGLGSEWPEEFEKIAQYVGDPKVTTTAAYQLGGRGAEAMSILKNKVEQHNGAYYSNASRLFIDLKNIVAKIKSFGGVVMQDPTPPKTWKWVGFCSSTGFILGFDLKKTNRQDVLAFPIDPKFIKIDMNYFVLWSLIDGAITINFLDATVPVVKIKLDTLISSEEMLTKYFPSAPIPLQVQMMQPIMASHPRLKEWMFKRMSTYTRSRLYGRLVSGEGVNDSHVKQILERYGSGEEVLACDGTEFDQKAHQHRLEKAFERAQNASSPQAKRARTSVTKRTPGLTRQKPKFVAVCWGLKSNPPEYLGMIRSHRTEQGADADVLRLTWPHKFTPKLNRLFPEVSAAPDPMKNAKAYYVPILSRELGLEEDSTQVVRHDSLADDDEDLWISPEELLVQKPNAGKQSVEKPAAAGSKNDKSSSSKAPAMKKGNS